MKTKAFGNEAKANHQQEAQAKNNNRRMAVYKTRQRFAGQQHQRDGDNDGGHHDGQVINHPDCRNHRVERKNGIQNDDLLHEGPKLRPSPLRGVIAVFTFQAFVELNGGLKEQEQTAEQHNQIARAETEIAEGKKRVGERNQP